MAKQDTKYWREISKARDALAKQLEGNEEVYYVDIGYPHSDAGAKEPSLRVHTSGRNDDRTFPRKFGSIPVVIANERDDS